MNPPVIVLLSLALAGCGIANMLKDPPPHHVGPAESAGASEVIGSRTIGEGVKANQRAYLIRVDGLPLLRKDCGFDKAMRVIPGKRSLDVSYLYGSMHARTTLVADIPPDDKVVIKYQLVNEKAVRLWLEISSGAILSEAGPLNLTVHPSAAGAPPFFAMLNLARDCP